MSPELPDFKTAKDAFLSEHQKDLTRFLDVIHTHFDRANDEMENNDGQLRKPLNDENLFACQWRAPLPHMPGIIASYVPFKPDELVEIHARYRYGSGSSMVNIWINNVGGEFKTFALGLIIDPRTGHFSEFGSNAGSDKLGHIRVNPQDVQTAVDAIFANNSTYQEAAKMLGLVDAFRLGVGSQVDYGAELYTVEHAGKVFGARSKSSRKTILNYFNLNVMILDRLHPHNKPSETEIVLRRNFGALDFPPEEIFGGILEQSLRIVKNPDGRITDISRNSSVNFANELTSTQINGQESMVLLYNKSVKNIPQQLAALLYPNPLPTTKDIHFFGRLVTRPIQREDIYLN